MQCKNNSATGPLHFCGLCIGITKYMPAQSVMHVSAKMMSLPVIWPILPPQPYREQ